jgi:hypothetical protein
MSDGENKRGQAHSEDHPAEEKMARAIRAGCNAADVHLSCSYPECSCTKIPAAVIAASAELMSETKDDGQ